MGGKKSKKKKNASKQMIVTVISNCLPIEDAEGNMFLDPDHDESSSIVLADNDNEAHLELENKLEMVTKEWGKKNVKYESSMKELQAARNLCNTLKEQVKMLEEARDDSENLDEKLLAEYNYLSSRFKDEREVKEVAINELAIIQAKIQKEQSHAIGVEDVEREKSKYCKLMDEAKALKSSIAILEKHIKEKDCHIEKFTSECAISLESTKCADGLRKLVADLNAQLEKVNVKAQANELKNNEVKKYMGLKIKDMKLKITSMEELISQKDAQIACLATTNEDTNDLRKQIEDLKVKLEAATTCSKNCGVDHEMEHSMKQGMATIIESLKFQISILEQNIVEHKRRIEVLTKSLQMTPVNQECKELIAKDESLQKKIKELECLCQYTLLEKQKYENELKECVKRLEVAAEKVKTIEKLEASTKKLDSLLNSSQVSNEKMGFGLCCK